MPEAYRLNKYVLTGEGDPKKPLKGMYFWDLEHSRSAWT